MKKEDGRGRVSVLETRDRASACVVVGKDRFRQSEKQMTAVADDSLLVWWTARQLCTIHHKTAEEKAVGRGKKREQSRPREK
ncbi:hypothetical protein NC652_037666 [Populus alba x Populus x berolinensis]|nr:hypothetical protein NC652_037666 [Populus alba x Populus x berolinensis]